MRTKRAPSKPHLKSSKVTYQPRPTSAPEPSEGSKCGHAAPANQTHEIWNFLVLEGIVTEDLNQALRDNITVDLRSGTAVTLGYLGPNELSRWLEHQAKYPGRLGDILIRERRLTRREVNAIIAEQQAHSEPLGTLSPGSDLITRKRLKLHIGGIRQSRAPNRAQLKP